MTPPKVTPNEMTILKALFEQVGSEKITLLGELFQKALPDMPHLGEALSEKDPAKLQEVATFLSDPRVQTVMLDCIQDAGLMQGGPEPKSLEELRLARPGQLDEIPTDQRVLHNDEGKATRLNPFFEALLIERIQFDGDIPELREAPASLGVTPAIGVDTAVANPVALGLMMEEAQEIVQVSVEKAQADTLHLLNQTLGSEDPTEMVPTSPLTVESSLYKAEGRVPAPLKVPEPSGLELARLSPKRKSELVWKVASTTQGRRSALGALQNSIRANLKRLGFLVQVVDVCPSNVGPQATWTFPLQDGSGSVQGDFSHIAAASAILTKKLVTKMFDYYPHSSKGFSMKLFVSTVDAISERTAGWRAVLGFGGAEWPSA